MVFGGTHRIPAARDVVWQALMNPEILARALPGREKLEANPDGSYRAQMKAGWRPSKELTRDALKSSILFLMSSFA
jgi:carbon monoxide dehydrogenase subunit G